MIVRCFPPIYRRPSKLLGVKRVCELPVALIPRHITVNSKEQAQNAESKRLVKIAMMGNLVITTAKALAWATTGSSAMLSETIHSLVDSGNQALLLIGLKGAVNAPDKFHQYGYGKAIYFWSLVSALGTFWFGAGISGWNSLMALANPNVAIEHIGPEVWSILAVSFAVDGFVLTRTVKSLYASKPKGVSFIQHCRTLRDPTSAAVLMEDSAACFGICLAVVGIGASQMTAMPVYDGLAGLGIASLLGSMGLYLARLNQKFLLGQAIDPDIVARIRAILLSRASIEEVHSEQSQWIGPNSFSYKAAVSFDGTYLAAKLMERYQNEFAKSKNTVDETKLLLAWYAEDVMRTVEQEVKEVETAIRSQFPEAVYIELEPDSRKNENDKNYAIDDGNEITMRRLEMETINQLQKNLNNNGNDRNFRDTSNDL